MSNNVFYTVMEGDKFIHSNICCSMTDNIASAVRFSSIDDLRGFMKNLNIDRNFKSVKVKYELEDMKL